MPDPTPDVPPVDLTAEELAQQFHETYERLAPLYGYQTREASAVPWRQVPANNRRLMVSVADEILGGPVARIVAARVAAERAEWAGRLGQVEAERDRLRRGGAERYGICYCPNRGDNYHSPGAPGCVTASPSAAAAPDEGERLIEAVKDVCWRAVRYGETEDGDTAYYLVTKGAMHRLVAACPGAAFRSDDSETLPDGAK